MSFVEDYEAIKKALEEIKKQEAEEAKEGEPKPSDPNIAQAGASTETSAWSWGKKFTEVQNEINTVQTTPFCHLVRDRWGVANTLDMPLLYKMYEGPVRTQD